jgi:hypothetical protein
MRKEITPKQVMNGDADYSLEEFLTDLSSEIKSSMMKDIGHSKEGEPDDKEFEKTVNEVFRFVSEICFKAAIHSPDLKLLLKESKSEEREIIAETLKSNKDNIALLRALLMNQVASRVKQGLTRRQAAKQVISQNKGVLIDFLGKSARKYHK